MNTLKTNKLTHIILPFLLMVNSHIALAEHDTASQTLAASLNNTWNELFNQADSEALSRLYARDAVLSPGNGQVLQGREAIAGLFQSFFDNGVSHHSLNIVESYLQGDLLYQVAYWRAEGEKKDGVTPSFGGVVTLISSKEASGEWKLQVHTWNAEQ